MRNSAQRPRTLYIKYRWWDFRNFDADDATAPRASLLFFPSINSIFQSQISRYCPSLVYSEWRRKILHNRYGNPTPNIDNDPGIKTGNLSLIPRSEQNASLDVRRDCARRRFVFNTEAELSGNINNMFLFVASADGKKTCNATRALIYTFSTPAACVTYRKKLLKLKNSYCYNEAFPFSEKTFGVREKPRVDEQCFIGIFDRSARKITPQTC